ncbi:MAG: cytochrome c-type biogenesis protein [Marinagarivorans sp.]|nr:cytochrome c-type biogenesis protein [Marinagarivorans sp.]
MIKQFLALFALAGCINYAHAGIDTYEFKTPQEHDRYNHFVEVLRCPKCKNQNLAGSGAPIAVDLKRELYRLIQEQQSDHDIEKFMVDRYGDFVLYDPPVQKNTYVLWYGPVAMIIFGLFILFLIVWRRSKNTNVSGGLTDGEQERFETFIKQADLNQFNKK